MPRVSKRKKKAGSTPDIKYYKTYIYVRLSEKDGGHGRMDSISIQKQICFDFVKKHPEMLLMKVYSDNGITGTTFARPEFEQLMEEVRAGKVDCIVVKDFSRFGRDAIDAVDLIDTIFPKLGVRFASVLDDYDSCNPACVNDRVNNILKHFMNDYYAREISAKLVQAHKISRDKGEFWGCKPPYGYKRSEESSKHLVPVDSEKEIIQQIFYWYVFEDMSGYDIAKELNAMGTLTPQESYELREYGKTKRSKKILWGCDRIHIILQNPVYIGAAVGGKTKQMLCENIPLHLVPRDKWEIQEDVWEPLIERTIFEKAQEIRRDRWKDTVEQWAANLDAEPAANGLLRGRIYCANCGRKIQRSRGNDIKGGCYYYYRCPSYSNSEGICKLGYVNEIYVIEALDTALRYQISLAVDYHKKYGMDFYLKLKKEAMQKINKAKERYEKYSGKLETLFEHYATGILNKEEYLDIKESYLKEQDIAYKEFVNTQKHCGNLLDWQRAKLDWAEGLLKCQDIKEINRGIVERFIEKVSVKSPTEIEVCFWFGDMFQESEMHTEGGLSYAI